MKLNQHRVHSDAGHMPVTWLFLPVTGAAAAMKVGPEYGNH